MMSQGDRQMEPKPAQNIQDTFLNTARKDRVPITLYLLSGVKLSGRIRSFDKYSVVLETNNQEQLIFKHAISTVVMSKPAGGHAERESRPFESRATGSGSGSVSSSAATPTTSAGSTAANSTPES
jgi:host factor-I protein